jgi:hypothetical protein
VSTSLASNPETSAPAPVKLSGAPLSAGGRPFNKLQKLFGRLGQLLGCSVRNPFPRDTGLLFDGEKHLVRRNLVLCKTPFTKASAMCIGLRKCSRWLSFDEGPFLAVPRYPLLCFRLAAADQQSWQDLLLPRGRPAGEPEPPAGAEHGPGAAGAVPLPHAHPHRRGLPRLPGTLRPGQVGGAHVKLFPCSQILSVLVNLVFCRRSLFLS